MTSNIEIEISNEIPRGIRKYNPKTTTPLLTAFGCVLMERDTAKGYVYTAVNINTHKSEVLSRRISPLTTSQVGAIVEKMRRSKVAGEGMMEADRPLDNKMTLSNVHEVTDFIFAEILPKHGFTIRKEQVSLAHHIIDAIGSRKISLAEAQVGTGKTLAYLIPAILAKRSNMNGILNMSFYTGSPLMEVPQMPVTIATSSIALQKAILTSLTKLSDILLEHGIIRKPLTAVIRKGRANYICERNLRHHAKYERDSKSLKLLKNLLEPTAPIDIAEVDGANEYIRRRITVPSKCNEGCKYRDSCRYIKFREESRTASFDIQICNHHYFLTDALRRAEGNPPLIQNYQCMIIDEAHKLLPAAQSMYGYELPLAVLLRIEESCLCIKFKSEAEQKAIIKAAGILAKEGKRLFRRLGKYALNEEMEDDTDKHKAVFGKANRQHCRNIHLLANGLANAVSDAGVSSIFAARKEQLLSELEEIVKQIAPFMRHEDYICWLEKRKYSDSSLHAIPKEIDKLLYDDLWNTGIPAILTSGTLSAAGDFSRIKRKLGISYLNPCRVVETTKPSPFDYFNNSMIYISENMPFPDQKDLGYINAVADEAEQLIYASHGHAAILFTSYKVMDMVWERMRQRNMPFPFFRLDKGGVREIDRFKESGNGVLFASGAFWEGIDIPGDALSLLIIVKLPFQAPDPISEYERSLYSSPNNYRNKVLIPDAQVRSKQAYGRLIRLEDDTGVVAFFDSRMGVHGFYREPMLRVFPKCYVTSDKTEVKAFFIVKKPKEYFK